MSNEEYPPGPISHKIFPNRALKDAIAAWDGLDTEEELTDDSDVEVTSWMHFNVETNSWECKKFSPKATVIRVGNTGMSFSMPSTPTPVPPPTPHPHAPAIARLRRVVERNRNNRNI